MKKLLLSSVAFLGVTAGAMAADLPSRRAPAPYVAVPVFTWTGFYVGVNAGYGFSDNNNNNQFGTGLTTISAPAGAAANLGFPAGVFGFGNGNNGGNRDGFVGGGQIGYNYQIGSFVIGIEADIQYADFGRNNNNNGGFGVNNGFATAIPVPATPGRGVTAPVAGAPGNVAFFNNGFNGRGGLDWFGTVRGRLGFAMDRLLIFGTGGLAFTDSGNNNNGFFGASNGAAIPAPFYFNAPSAAAGALVGAGAFGRVNNRDDIGYAVGGGVEYAFTPNLTAKVEGLYVNFSGGGNNNAFGNNVVGVTNTGAPVFAAGVGNRNNDLDFGVVRAGLNYKFNLF